MPAAISSGRSKDASRRCGGFSAVTGVPGDAVSDGRVYVSVGVVPKQAATRPHPVRRPPGTPSWTASNRNGNDRVAGYVAGDVLPSVVGPHLLLVDVLLEDISEHVWVDLIVLTVGPLVKVPAIFVEEVEDSLERFVWDGDVGVIAAPGRATSNSPPLRKGTLPNRAARSGALWASGWPRPFVEQSQKEEPVELLEAFRRHSGLALCAGDCGSSQCHSSRNPCFCTK